MIFTDKFYALLIFKIFTHHIMTYLLSKRLVACTFFAALLFATMSMAYAQSNTDVLQKPRPHALADPKMLQDKKTSELIRHRTSAVTFGAGAAVDAEGNLHRSHYRMGLVELTASASEYSVKKGQFVIRDSKIRSSFATVENTWKITINNDVFSATGKVKDSSANTYDVSLTGSKIRSLKDGNLYRVEGKFVGNGVEYELHYLSAIFKKSIPATSLPPNVLDS